MIKAKEGVPMRKFMLLSIILLLVLACVPAYAAMYSFDSIYATVNVPSEFTTILTPDTIGVNEGFITGLGTTPEQLRATFEADGILLQAWDAAKERCLVISAQNKDGDAEKYFDIDQQTPETRAAYRKEHLTGDAYAILGYDYQEAEWKKSSVYGRFLMLKYVQSIGGEVQHRGYARRTIRNGYTITVDLQVYGRSLKKADDNLMNDVMDTWKFASVLPMPELNASYHTVYTKAPPTETSTGKFTVKGTTLPSAVVTYTLFSSTRGIQINDTVTANKKGNFSFDIALTTESDYIFNLTVHNGNTVSEDLLQTVIRFSKSNIPVTFDDIEFEQAAKPSGSDNKDYAISTDKLVISGITDKGVRVQLNCNGENSSKTVGANGQFSFNVKTNKEQEYVITLTFSSKGNVIRTFKVNGVRTFTEAERRAAIKAEAVKPAYSTLTSKLKGYTGRTMGYTVYVVSIEEEAGGGYLSQMAFVSRKSGYKDFIYVRTDDAPSFSVDDKIKIYAVCTGGLDVTNETGKTVTYPSFDLLFFE